MSWGSPRCNVGAGLSLCLGTRYDHAGPAQMGCLGRVSRRTLAVPRRRANSKGWGGEHVWPENLSGAPAAREGGWGLGRWGLGPRSGCDF